MVAPLVGAAIISGISGLLGGALSGAGKAADRKQSYADWLKQANQKRSWAQEFKPKSNYSTYGNLPVMDEFIKRAVMGYFGKTQENDNYLGSSGINMSDFMSRMFPVGGNTQAGGDPGGTGGIPPGTYGGGGSDPGNFGFQPPGQAGPNPGNVAGDMLMQRFKDRGQQGQGMVI